MGIRGYVTNLWRSARMAWAYATAGCIVTSDAVVVQPMGAMRLWQHAMAGPPTGRTCIMLIELRIRQTGRKYDSCLYQLKR